MKNQVITHVGTVPNLI